MRAILLLILPIALPGCSIDLPGAPYSLDPAVQVRLDSSAARVLESIAAELDRGGERLVTVITGSPDDRNGFPVGVTLTMRLRESRFGVSLGAPGTDVATHAWRPIRYIGVWRSTAADEPAIIIE